MRIAAAEATQLFGGTASHPLQIVRVTLASHEPGPVSPAPVTLHIAGPGVRTPVPFRIQEGFPPGAGLTAEVPVEIAAPHGPGSVLPVTVIAESDAGDRAEFATTITAAEPGWTMWMVSHFHYDPVWWGTQGQFTQSRLLLPGEDGGLPDVRTAFDLVRLHLAAARADPDYKFVLAELDYLKPHFDAHPEDRDDLRKLIAGGRIEIVGGNYNEPNTNLTCAESTIRNAVYGIGYQRDVAGGDPRAAWMLDAFGHDPGYPGLMAAAGLTESAWARGPYHQWGPHRTVGDNARMQFPSEFEWVSPDGSGLLTSYMPNHYGAGWATHQAPDLAAAEREALAQFSSLAPAAATRNVLLPVGADHVIPSRWATAIHRDWNSRYAWPRFVTALPGEFFAAVRREAAERGIWITPQTRDFNPVYPGKDVSYIDTKQAQRAAETAVLDGERLATLAWLAGADYPAESLDKAWRQLVYGAHHDAITGTESDQVYLDLLGGWREAFERGDATRRAAAAHLAGLASTAPPAGLAAAVPAGAAAQARPIVVFNTLSWARPGQAEITLDFPGGAARWLTLADERGTAVPFLAGGVRWHPDGSLSAVTLTFRASEIPALGYRTYWALPADAGTTPDKAGWEGMPGCVIENEVFRVEADPARGGTLASVIDKRTGTELLTGPGNELVLQEEYDYHPRWGEGPWLLSPKGPGTGSAAAPAAVRAERGPLGARLVAEFRLGELRVTQETLLWNGAGQVEFRTHTDGSIGQDRLLRARFPAQVPGGLPVFQTATAVVGRPFGATGADVAEHPFTLDNPAHEWFGLGSTARVLAGGIAHAIGVAEVILPAAPAGESLPGPLRDAIRGLVAALAREGVTATCSWPDGPRYGSLDLDSNVPDVRIALGGAARNPWTARLLGGLAGPGQGPPAEGMTGEGMTGEGGPAWLPAARARAEVFVPGTDVRGPRDLPVLIVSGDDLTAAITAVTADLADSAISARTLTGHPDPGPPLAGRCVALLNRGTPGSVVTPAGELCIALMRACSAWPSGVWIDGERRTVPDGSSFAWQHWSHTFEYALAAGTGDWRDAGFPVAGQEYNHALLAIEAPAPAGNAPAGSAPAGSGPAGSGSLPAGKAPARASLAEVTGGGPAVAGGRPAVMLSALKPRGNPLASGRPGTPHREDGVTVRLRDAGARLGTAQPAQVRLFTGIAAARPANLLEVPVPERPGSVPREGTVGPDGAAMASVPPAGTVTLAIMPGGAAAAAWPGSARQPPGPPEPAQPVHTRYWLHGKGPAPAGNLPVAVHVTPARVALDAGKPATVRVTVACGPEPAAGLAGLHVPSGLLAAPGGPFRYDLPAMGHVAWELAVRPAPGAVPGRYFLAAQIGDPLGQLLLDTTLITVGLPPPPTLAEPLEELLPMLEADEQASTGELSLDVLTPALTLPPGGHGEVAIQLTSHVASLILGEAQLLSPFGSWDAAGPWTQGFAAGPGQSTTVRYPVRVPATCRPGSAWWALVKVTYFGRVRYSESVPVSIGR